MIWVNCNQYSAIYKLFFWLPKKSRAPGRRGCRAPGLNRRKNRSIRYGICENSQSSVGRPESRAVHASGPAPLKLEEASMRRLLGLVLAGGMVLGHAAAANAQLSISLGNPSYFGSYGGYGYGYPSYGNYLGGYSPFYSAPLVGATTYSSGYSGYVAPGTSFYSSSYYPAAGVYTAPIYPSYGYGSSYYGYAPYARSGYGYGY